MGNVSFVPGDPIFGNNPFFSYTYFPIENTGALTNVSYDVQSGAGTGSLTALPSQYQGYTYLALNNDGQDDRYLYGVQQDGTRVSLGLFETPFKTVGVNVVSQTKVDTPDVFALESQDQSQYILFSNSTLALPATAVFTAPQGDYVSPVCFCTGTLIRTARGDVAVEALVVGDLAETASGHHKPIRWIGHREIDCAAEANPSAVHPIRILAGAFGGDLPERDLYLSPGHPVLVGEGDREVLVPIMCLINGTSVAQTTMKQITYWHVELEQHDILLAEGLPAESFLDYGNRPWFENGAEQVLANPDIIPPGLDGRCRPVAIDGPIVEAERRRLNALFEMSLSAQCAWPLFAESWAAV